MTTRFVRVRAIPLLIAVAITAAGCGGISPQKSPAGEAPIPPKVDVAPPVASMAATVFYPDWQVQHMIPELRQVPEATGAELATQLVRELIAGPTDPHLQRPFPADVKLLGPVKLQGGTATVNLSKEIRSLQGSAAVTAALNSLRLSLTEIDGIERVQVLVEGRSAGELGGIVLEPMDRGLYLYPVIPNPERAAYLQVRYNQGLETWRADALKAAQWEGRMFGFTAAELQDAAVEQQGAKAQVQVNHGGAIYTLNLAQNQEVQGQGIWTIEALDPLVRYTAGGLPSAVRDWVQLYADTTVGVAQHAGGETFLVAAVEEGAVQIDSVAVEDGQLVVYVVEKGNQRVSAASLSGADASLPVVFRWKSAPVGAASKNTAPDALPMVANPHQVPEAKLTGDTVIVTPAAEQKVSGAITIKGYARHLFEARIVARLLDHGGKEVASVGTNAAASGFDWGSFEFVLEHKAPAGAYRLELGTYSAKDGTWQPRAAVAVTVGQ